MITRRLTSAAVLLLCTFLASPARAADADKPVVAIMDFGAENTSAGEAAVVSEFVRQAVIRSGKLRVVEKKNQEKILSEQAFQQTGCTSADCAVKLGKLLSARKMIVGQFSAIGGVRFLTASLVDVETGEVEQAGRVRGFDPATADTAADQLVSQLTGVKVAVGTNAEVRETVPAKPSGPPPRSHTRFGVGASGGFVGYTVQMSFRSPSSPPQTGSTDVSDIWPAGSLALRVPLSKGGGVVAGLDIGFIYASRLLPSYMTPYSGGTGQFRMTKAGSSAEAPGSALLYSVTGSVIVGLTDTLGLRIGVELVTFTFPDMSFYYTSPGGPVWTLMGNQLAQNRSIMALTGGLEWFMDRHLALDLWAKPVIGSGNDNVGPGDNAYGVSFKSFQFGSGLAFYF